VQSNYFDNNSTIYQQSNPTIQLYPTTYKFFEGGSSIYQESNLSEINFSEDNCDIGTNLTLVISEYTSTIDIDNSSNVNILSHVIENNYDDNDDEENDIGPDYLTGLETGEDYTEDYDILDNDSEIEKPQRTNNTLLVTGRTKRHHPVKALNNIETFDCLGTNECQSRPNDELAKNILFGSKATLIWTINDSSVKKNVQCWTQNSSKIKLIMKYKV
jgi:hypothetical protein